MSRVALPSKVGRGETWLMVGVVLVLHLLGWGLLAVAVTQEDLTVGTAGAFGIGLGVTAYTLGMRHAFDADHIAAIDNTARKLMNEGGRPASVGLWFSLGHSTVVFVLAVLIAAGARSLTGQVQDENSGLQQAAGVIGTLVSGTFLLLIGLINLALLVGIVKVFRDMRRGTDDEGELERRINDRGLIGRVAGRATRAITRPWQMYPVGLLFGLGFDTATEIALLALAGGAGASTLPWYAILCLPILFAAGMSLFDTADGYLMVHVYGWAIARPVRKVYYNLTVTALSVLVALLIGGIELLGLLAEKLGLGGPVWDTLRELDLNYVGYAVVVLFVLTWVVALAVWRFGRIEERWSGALGAAAKAGHGAGN